MNKVILTGRMTKDPDVRVSGENKVARFTLAVDRRFKSDAEVTADFISCVSFGKQAEFVEKYFKKGSKANLVGRIQTGSYTNKDGQKVYTTDVAVEEIEFGESKSSAEGKPSTSSSSSDDGDFMNIDDSIKDDMPF